MSTTATEAPVAESDAAEREDVQDEAPCPEPDNGDHGWFDTSEPLSAFLGELESRMNRIDGEDYLRRLTGHLARAYPLLDSYPQSCPDEPDAAAPTNGLPDWSVTERADSLCRIETALDRLVPSVATWLAEALEEHISSDDWERDRFQAIMFVGPNPGEWFSSAPEPTAEPASA